jgi:hypothetical protein
VKGLTAIIKFAIFEILAKSQTT